jgi:uncharacterized membrane protein YbhN (UPF0104 family)
MAALPAIGTDDPLAALGARGGDAHGALRRLAPLAAVAALAVALAVAAPRVAHVFADALVRALHADPRWAAAAVAFEIASFAGYVALFWHVAGRMSPRFGLRASYEVALASTAATRLLPTAGAGGAALTFWSLKRAGGDGAAATRTLLTFLVVLYSVFLGSLVVAGTLLATGAAPSAVSLQLSVVPAATAALAIAIALLLAARHARAGAQPAPRARVARAAHALGGAVHDALATVRRPHPRLLGAIAWWGFDMLVIWAAFNAFGSPPAPALLVLGYFLGQVANTVPLPGAASGGMVGAFLALGMPAAVVLPSVLAYRAIAIWTPVPAGAAALTGLRRTVRRWRSEDEARSAAEADARGLEAMFLEPAALGAGAVGQRVEVELLEPALLRQHAEVDPHRELPLHA